MVDSAAVDQNGRPAARAGQRVHILSTDKAPARERVDFGAKAFVRFSV